MKLTEKAISDSPPRMGRPSLNLKTTVVRLKEEALQRIDALLGKNMRAKFIRDAVDEKLERDEGSSNNRSNNSD